MSLLLNALKKAEEGEKKDGQTPAPESEAQASGASAPAATSAAPTAPTPPASPESGTPAPAASGAPAPATTPATPSTSGTAAPAAPAARPGGLTGGGGLSLKKPATSAIPTPATAAAERMAGPAGIGGGVGLKKTVAAPPPPSPPDGDATEDEDRSKAGRILRGSGGVGGDTGEEGDAPRFRGLRNFLAAAVLLVAIGGGGYFTLEAGFIPGMSVDSLKIIVGWDDPPPPRVATQQNIPELNVADGAVLRLPRPAIDVQSEIDFTDVSESPVGSEDRDEYVQRIAVLTGYNAAKEAREQRERAEQEAQIAESLGELSEQDLAGLVDLGEEEESAESAVGESAAAAAQRLRAPLSDEVFTASESRAEKARLEALTPSEEDIHIISASEKIALVAAAEAAMEADAEAMESEAAPAEGEAVAQADGESAPAPADSESEAVAETESAPEKMETMDAPTIVTPSLEGEKRREMLERAKAFYLAGRLTQAEAVYRNVLRADQNNLDAMRGIAQIALSSGRRQLASTMYTRILSFYPGDPIAIAELANLQTGGDPLAMERRIRSAIGVYPESDARLYFALGNLYAERRLWSKAQEAYFEAVSLEADNPDYVYNLAVVLDYLNKPALAAQYYRRAVDLAEFSPSGFNLARTRARIQDLEQ